MCVQSIKDALADLTMVKDVWDTSMLCELQFADWKDTLWSDIRTEVMEDGAKTFVKEVKSLHKKVCVCVCACVCTCVCVCACVS